MDQNKSIRCSRDGYEFDENKNSWHISKDIKINFSNAILSIDKKTLNGFRKALAVYAEKYSSYHTINMYNRFHELVVNTQLKTIDTHTLLNWKTNLGKEREWHLGALKGFLLSWNEYGYYGVDKAVVSLLESFTLIGNDKGKSVLMRCPYTGAFTENEILALMTELARLWKEDLISFETYAYIQLLQATARRPIQIRHLKFEDLKKEVSQGTWNYFLNIPSAKKRGGLFRKTFKKLAITEDLYLVLLNFVEYQYKKLLSLIDESVISD
ncbi:integrase [Eikenella halliae]|uniref:integrase n=1 Tax=Eikenella halliae TaxID=1795832 RepID=UPI000A5A8EBF|nr:integrase [Eikenella halliae]